MKTIKRILASVLFFLALPSMASAVVVWDPLIDQCPNRPMISQALAAVYATQGSGNPPETASLMATVYGYCARNAQSRPVTEAALIIGSLYAVTVSNENLTRPAAAKFTNETLGLLDNLAKYSSSKRLREEAADQRDTIKRYFPH